MGLQFSRAEHDARIAKARARLAERGLDALLIFAQESHYYLTGFDTNGYVFFQCAVLTTDETPITLLTRKPDLEGARRTSIIEDVRIWYDAEGADPALELKAILEEKRLHGRESGSSWPPMVSPPPTGSGCGQPSAAGAGSRMHLTSCAPSG